MLILRKCELHLTTKAQAVLKKIRFSLWKGSYKIVSKLLWLTRMCRNPVWLGSGGISLYPSFRWAFGIHLLCKHISVAISFPFDRSVSGTNTCFFFSSFVCVCVDCFAVSLKAFGKHPAQSCEVLGFLPGKEGVAAVSGHQPWVRMGKEESSPFCPPAQCNANWKAPTNSSKCWKHHCG